MGRLTASAFVLAVLALPSDCLAQTRVMVEGRVVDESTGAGVPSAAVELRGQGFRLTADDGTFRFNALVPGTYALSIIAFGYATATRIVEVRQDLAVSVALERAPIQLEGVGAELVEVRGRVRDPKADFLLVDALVATDLGQVSGTDAHGRFRLRGVLEDEPVRVRVQAFGYLPLDTVLDPRSEQEHVLDLEVDPVTMAMIEVQVDRIERRSAGRRAILFRTMDRERLLRYAGPHTLRSAIEFEYSDMWLRRVQCVFIDERALSVMTTLTVLGTMVPEEVERIEFIGRGEWMRIYTRAFMQDMVSRDVPLRDLSLSPVCPP